MRQLLVQRKRLNRKEWTAVLLAKSRQWRDPGKHGGPNYIPESLEAKLQVSVVGGRVTVLAPMNAFPTRRGCTRHATKRLGEVALIGKTVLYSDVGERVTALQ